jgi:hypothetical protein
MNSEEISKLFKLDQVDFEQCKSAEEYELELSNQVDDFFFKNYFKNEEILFAAFDFYYSINLLENSENLEKIKILLNNNKIFNYLENKKMGVISLIIIITAYDKSTDYYISNIKNKENYQNKKIKEIDRNYNKFINSTEDFQGFKLWYKDEIKLFMASLFISLRGTVVKNEMQRKICENLILNNSSMKKISDLDYLFNKYIENIGYSNINNKELVEKEKNLKINKFVRDVYDIFLSLIGITLSKSFISELVLIFYGKTMDEKQIENIINNRNISVLNIQYKKIYNRDQNNNIINMEILRDDSFQI